MTSYRSPVDSSATYPAGRGAPWWRRADASGWLHEGRWTHGDMTRCTSSAMQGPMEKLCKTVQDMMDGQDARHWVPPAHPGGRQKARPPPEAVAP
nr:hypothetical protein Itr_chr15CG15790 [Ipomoea trifida]